jgi:hypothetical protein
MKETMMETVGGVWLPSSGLEFDCAKPTGGRSMYICVILNALQFILYVPLNEQQLVQMG